ncbi:hypothetical protein FQN57_002924 [Myotisia sp. PD_48]|nr:hypothetical protein FQN57_002924 [Myotisia sp. PD_48]
MLFGTYLLGALCAAGTALAHLEMSKPYALRSRFDPANKNGMIDYDNTSPMSPSGSNFPCRGHHRSATFRSVADYTAGSTQEVNIAGSATHGGGSCQLSMSYDNGQTFKVIMSMMGGCPLPKKYSFTVPTFAPNGQALFAWSWFNLIGNREMYMNCAHVTISGGSDDSTEFNALPDLWTANVGKGCRTAEGKDTIFRNPGKNVIYGGKVTASTPVFPNCG